MWTPENRARVAEMTSQEAGHSLPPPLNSGDRRSLSPDSPALSVSSTHHAPQFRVSRSFCHPGHVAAQVEMQWECLAEYNWQNREGNQVYWASHQSVLNSLSPAALVTREIRLNGESRPGLKYLQADGGKSVASFFKRYFVLKPQTFFVFFEVLFHYSQKAWYCCWDDTDSQFAVIINTTF